MVALLPILKLGYVNVILLGLMRSVDYWHENSSYMFVETSYLFMMSSLSASFWVLYCLCSPNDHCKFDLSEHRWSE